MTIEPSGEGRFDATTHARLVQGAETADSAEHAWLYLEAAHALTYTPLKIQGMRAFLVMLMLTFLPVRFSAAAVVACCGHVDAMRAPHAMHHQPAQGLAVPAELGIDNTATDSSSFGLDCGTCHANCAAAVSTTTATVVDPCRHGARSTSR